MDDVTLGVLNFLLGFLGVGVVGAAWFAMGFLLWRMAKWSDTPIRRRN